MAGKKLICYEKTHAKLHWTYKSFFKNDYEIIDVADIEREIEYCSDSTHYIMAFIEMLKHKVIRRLPDLSKVQMRIGVFDKDNVLHRLMVGAYYVICNMLKKDAKKISLYKTIFTTINYEGELVFMGALSFDGIK